MNANLHLTVVLTHEDGSTARITRVQSIVQTAVAGFRVATFGNEPVLHRVGERGVTAIAIEVTDGDDPANEIAPVPTPSADARAKLEQELEELRQWKAEQQRFLVAAAVAFVGTGYKGDGILEGIEYLKARALVATYRGDAV